MEGYAKSLVSAPANVIYLSTILGRDGPTPLHKCDWKCQNEHVCGNMFRCKPTGLTHICDKNCDQRILYDNHNSLCRVSGQIFPLSPAEEQAVRGIRRKLDADNSPTDTCASKRRRDAQFHPSPFERSFSTVTPICSQASLLFLKVKNDEAVDLDTELTKGCLSCFFSLSLPKNCNVDMMLVEENLIGHFFMAVC